MNGPCGGSGSGYELRPLLFDQGCANWRPYQNPEQINPFRGIPNFGVVLSWLMRRWAMDACAQNFDDWRYVPSVAHALHLARRSRIAAMSSKSKTAIDTSGVRRAIREDKTRHRTQATMEANAE